MENSTTYIASPGNSQYAKMKAKNNTSITYKKDDIISTIVDAYHSELLNKGVTTKTKNYLSYSFKTKDMKNITFKINVRDLKYNESYIEVLNNVCTRVNKVNFINKVKIAGLIVVGTTLLIAGGITLANKIIEKDNLMLEQQFQEWQNDPYYQKAMEAENKFNDSNSVEIDETNIDNRPVFDSEGNLIDYSKENKEIIKCR